MQFLHLWMYIRASQKCNTSDGDTSCYAIKEWLVSYQSDMTVDDPPLTLICNE
jgi:hypothetical protein